MDKPVVKELIQDDLTPENIKSELDQLLTNPKRQRAILEDYDELTIEEENKLTKEELKRYYINLRKKNHLLLEEMMMVHG